jgi:WD40 repeat protein
MGQTWVVKLTCLVFLLVCVTSCGGPVSPGSSGDLVQTMPWTERPGNLAEWGCAGGAIYAVLWNPETKEERIVVWTWQQTSMKEAWTSIIPRAIGVVPAGDGVCGLSPVSDDAAYSIFSPADSSVSEVWKPGQGGCTFGPGGSANGKFIAVVIQDPVYIRGIDLARVGIIDVAAKKLKSVTEINGHGIHTVYQSAVSNDGRYVAVAGWDNGVAMIDGEQSKVLWSSRPPDEISTAFAIFAPDGKTLFTAGSEGCVYSIDAATGQVLTTRYASTSGKKADANRVSSLAISDDGQWLAAGTGPQGVAYIWSLSGANPIRILVHGDSPVSIVAFSPDARHIATVGGGDMKIWSIKK